MKRCPACLENFEGRDWRCSQCGHQPGRIGEFPAFAPRSADFSEHFPPDSFQRLAPLEAGHFWFRARNELIVWAMRRWLPTEGKLLEIGCGTGFVLSRLEKDFPGLALSGGEIYVSGLRFASGRLTRTELIQMDALAIPYRGEFDVIGMFDTLEHIPQDEAALTEVHRALKPGGGLFLTVPQHAFLWSYVDEFSGHLRRYERSALARKVRQAGFRVVTVSSFVSLLLPIFWLARKREKRADFDAEAELRLSRPLNWALERVLTIERALIRAGIRFPWGGSLFLIAQKI